MVGHYLEIFINTLETKWKTVFGKLQCVMRHQSLHANSLLFSLLLYVQSGDGGTLTPHKWCSKDHIQELASFW